MDKHFRVELVTQTPNPATAIWISQHQCVDEGFAMDAKAPSEEKAGEYIVKHLLEGNRGHFSPFEAAQITFNVGGFSHRVMQQITRHRIGVHFSVQSFRYTGERIAKLGEYLATHFGGENGNRFFHQESSFWSVAKFEGWDSPNNDIHSKVGDLFYLRPVGEYRDREGKKFNYTEVERNQDLLDCLYLAYRYYQKYKAGMPEEMAAGMLPMDARQNWVMSFNVRSLCGLYDRRSPANAQLEIRQLCKLLWPYFEAWLPAVADWYKKNRYGKARLAP